MLFQEQSALQKEKKDERAGFYFKPPLFLSLPSDVCCRFSLDNQKKKRLFFLFPQYFSLSFRRLRNGQRRLCIAGLFGNGRGGPVRFRDKRKEQGIAAALRRNAAFELG